MSRWPERWLALRNRLYASPGFHRLSRIWPLRLVARRRAAALFNLVAGFVYSQVLLVCTRLALFDLLRDGARDLTWLAARTDWPEASLRSLLNAAAALDLIETLPGDRYALGSLGAVLTDNPSITAMILHHEHLYRDLAEPEKVLRDGVAETAMAAYWPYAAPGDAAAAVGVDAARRYSDLMGASQAMVTEQLLGAVSLRGVDHLLDVGGGDGSFIRAIADAYPAMRFTLFDLPAVCDVATARFDASLRRRVAVQPGSFRDDPLPVGADAVSLVRILHDHDDAVAQALLQAVRRALPPGGRLLVVEPLADTASARGMGHAYFSVYLRAMGSGRPRTFGEIRQMLELAGFSGIRQHSVAVPLVTSVITAEVSADA